jgi:uncharacterized repeat protein (TIGR04076 family)
LLRLGNVSIHRVGDKIVINRASIMLDKTDALCIHALSIKLHSAVALDKGQTRLSWG